MASDYSGIDRSLARGKFTPVGDIQSYMIPDAPGLYCIKVLNLSAIPKKYGEIRGEGIIYIGQASKSLFKRLWEEELNHKRPATFFRSIGAVLGYLPPEGSLAGKNTHNYKFSVSDTFAIKEWMKKNLAVCFNVLDPAILDDCEEYLIKKYAPLINIEHNPTPNENLRKARKHCVDVAKGFSGEKTVKAKKKAALPIDSVYNPSYREPHISALAAKPNDKETAPKEKPWYKDQNIWSLIMIGVLVLTIIGAVISSDIEFKREVREQRERANRPHPTWAEIMSEEELKKTGLDKAIKGPDINKTDPTSAAKNFRKLIENGGNANPTIDALQDSDFYDAIDQLGGEEGF